MPVPALVMPAVIANIGSLLPSTEIAARAIQA
jgi:hypothetical protein